MKRILLFILFAGLAFSSKSQTINLSDKAEVSVLTCGPSDLIYAIYGHTAIRVHDPARHWDVVFNYGVFSFSEPNFVYRFAKGNANYMLAPERFNDFYQDYIRNGRSIQEQVLNLNPNEKQHLLNFLINNSRPENREYRYDFFHDNCATRVRDVIAAQVDGKVEFPVENAGETFRRHVTDYQKILPWTNFGIQLVLGSPSDKMASAYEEMFLPDYLFQHFAEAKIVRKGESRPLVKASHTVYDAEAVQASWLMVHSPELILFLVFLLICRLCFRQLKSGKIHYGIDYLLLFIHGLIGLVLLWFFLYSEHPAMKANYNQLWAVCLNFPFLFVWLVKKWRPVFRWYWLLLSSWLLLFFPLSILFLPQEFHPGFYLLIAMLLCRSLLHSFFILRQK